MEHMEQHQGRLKLEIPMVDGETSNSVTSYVEAQCKYFSENLGRFDITFDNVVQTTLEEPGCERFSIYNYEIKSVISFSECLLPAIRQFLYSVQKDSHIPHFLKSTVIIHSAACFSKKVVSCHKYIPVAAIFFGNIQGGVFINHWEVSYRDRSEYKETGAEYAKIHVDFLYDQNDLILVAFDNKEWDKWHGLNPNVRTERIVCYHVVVRLGNIRRIVVDNAINDKNGRDRTRFHFELNCPVVIRRAFPFKNANGNEGNCAVYLRSLKINRGRVSGKIPDVLAISDSPVFTIELDESLPDAKIYNILSRLRMRSGISIEFSSLHVVDKLYSSKHCPYGCWTHNENGTVSAVTIDSTMKYFLTDTVRKMDVNECERYPSDIVRERKFSLTYLIECLISRGAIVKDQLLLDKVIWIKFLKVINFCYRQGREACLCALERLITMIDERKRIGSIIKAYIYEYEVQRAIDPKSTLSWQEIKEGYRKVRKLVITQSRVIYVVPETIMANRAMRKYDHDGTRMIRVTFRDDDNQIMRANKTSTLLIERTLRKYLYEGIVIAGRDFGYMGSSNSQMRDSGAYFLEKYSRKQLADYIAEQNSNPPITWQPKINEAREKLGRFIQMESVPKLMARLGQCFTQTRKMGSLLMRENYCTSYDFTGGSNNQGKQYIFSDGVGLISKDLAANIAREMELEYCVPSCYQFRFRGMKGVVVIDPLLDDITSWAKEFNIERPQMKFGSWDVKLVFRPSQIKFEAMRTQRESLEIVKYSSPIPVSLNKPFISILDQVSEMQSYKCHLRITNRIEELVDTQLRRMARTMLREHDCRNKLKELPRRVDIDKLSVAAGFHLSTEPFFRSLIKATIKFTIAKQLRKQQIQIPCEKGRTMFGVIDETGRLQYGQVFIQYTESVFHKAPSPYDSRKIVIGRVLLTKNPCNVAGDVRVFTAVDIPELHHLCDVVVFPICGPRPHTDEMAGSDLDGDEYVVIWDQDLLLERNESPFDYTPENPKTKPISMETLSDDMVDFYVKYIMQDSVGAISNSFLFQSDLYGIRSEVCQRLAMKISKAVDFTKTGCPPAPLVRDWTTDLETGEDIPPEKNEHQPDFHLGSDFYPTYRSPRLIGRIYRELKGIEDVLKISEEFDESDQIECDKCLIVDDWLAYKEMAEEQLSKYNGRLRAFMENYGVKTEGEIFSGCISEVRNRISDRDQDDMSFYNTNAIIEKKVTSLYREFREEFFKEFGGFMSCTRKIDKKFAFENNVFHRFAFEPTQNMKQKAVAYYRTCYEKAQQTREKMLSFAWIAYDVLAVVRQENVLKDPNSIHSTAPFYRMLRGCIFDHCERNKEKLYSFMKFLDQEACYQLRLYTNNYKGLNVIMFIICEWAERNRLFSVRLQRHHVCLILILYATGSIEGIPDKTRPFLEKLEELPPPEGEPENIDDYQIVEYQIELLVAFFEYLASRAFKKLQYISFIDLGYSAMFLHGEWLPMHEAAMRTYYNMVFNQKFEELSDDPNSGVLQSVIIRECEPIIIELPENITCSDVEKQILKKTGVEEVCLRMIHCREAGRFSLVARGTLQSLRKLRNLVTVEPFIKFRGCAKKIASQLGSLTYENIMW